MVTENLDDAYLSRLRELEPPRSWEWDGYDSFVIEVDLTAVMRKVFAEIAAHSPDLCHDEAPSP